MTRSEQRGVLTFAAIAFVFAVLACVVSGCAVIKPLAEQLLAHGIDRVDALAAGGQAKIDDAAARISAIPDAILRIEAALHVQSARLLWIETMIEWLIGDAGGAIVPVEDGATPEPIPIE
jgi:hypothetical protein